ncbi:hypothetical protein LTR67_007519 [Exophiala xenobiotica]
MLRKWRLSRDARLVRLRTALRSKPLIAALVKTLHVPDPHISLYLPNENPNPEYDAYLCTLASVVMACPNLEALTGFTSFYNHTFDRLSHALSTRAKLREHAWVIAENDEVRERSQKQLPPGLLDENQTFQFMLYHERWAMLETLALCSPGSLGVIEHQLFVDVVNGLLSLKNLCVSSFDADDFHDGTLLSFQPLTSVRLEECAGITDTGLTRWAASPRAARIERLALIHQNITSLLTLSKVFTSLDRLRKLTVVQTDTALSVPAKSGLVVFQPIMASKSLRFLHWDILCDQRQLPESANQSVDDSSRCPSSRRNEDPSLTPNDHLALSISHGGFPALTKLRAPRDASPYGVLQIVCRPVLDVLDATSYSLSTLQRLREDPCSNFLQVARLRAGAIAGRSSEQRNAAELHSTAITLRTTPGNKHEAIPQTDSENSLSSLNTSQSFLTDKSTDTDATDPLRLLSPVSPLSEQDLAYLSGGDSGKEVVRRGEPGDGRGIKASKRDSICQCEPNPESICVCDSQTRPLLDDGKTPTPPPKSHLRTRFGSLNRAPQPPGKLSSDALAEDVSGAQRRSQTSSDAASTIKPKRPIFYLEPDVVGHDENGGLVGWAELLGIREKAKKGCDSAETVHERSAAQTEEGVQDMCTGSWNRWPKDDWIASGDLGVVDETPGSTSGGASLGQKWKLKSKGKSTSSLSFSSDLKAELQQRKHDRRRHVARPRGERGGCIQLDDFF